jgi:putative colanic acid biosynthesis UDP-glucose lipid carrier transferase
MEARQNFLILPDEIVKRTMDMILSIILVALTFPLMLLIALMIKLDSKGPVFYNQSRLGKNGHKITIIKFRSMHWQAERILADFLRKNPDAQREWNENQKLREDPRITRVGRWIRKFSLDELPQFINVLKGEMSLVGPRPHPTPLNLESKENIKGYMLRHLVKPGITGWAQVNGFRGETKDPHLMEKRVEYDLWYIEHWSFWLDLQILFLTVWKMVKGDPKAY